MLGIAIAVFAEINFSLLTPFFLGEFGYNTGQIATFMSTVAIVDIGCRFASPFIGDYFKQTPRLMYMYSLLMLIITRTSKYSGCTRFFYIVVVFQILTFFVIIFA